ncbi:hypothetical protein Gotur_025537 [Gossypium turneri]
MELKSEDKFNFPIKRIIPPIC